MENRIKPLEGVRNFRDFGGYASAHGGAVKTGLLFRSGHYGEASEQDIAALEGMGIAFQLDLRRPDERERFPGRWAPSKVITNDGGREMQSPHHRFLQQVEADADIAEGWMVEYYEKAPFRAHHVELFQDWFRHLADATAPALVNCAAGKDRTGIICALTHHVLGVSEEDIFSDYELTNTAAKVDERLPEATAYFNNMLDKNYAPDVYKPFIGVRGRYLETAFASIRSEYASLDHYISDKLGVTDELRKQLIMRLVA